MHSVQHLDVPLFHVHNVTPEIRIFAAIEKVHVEFAGERGAINEEVGRGRWKDERGRGRSAAGGHMSDLENLPENATVPDGVV